MSKFDVFISFKNTGVDGEKTQDFYMAKDLYDALISNNIQVFFSPESIRKNAVYNYSEYIDNAIEDSDILIAVGTSADNLKSKWVKYEIDSFRNELLSGRKDETQAGMISYVSRNVSIDKMPLCLRSCEVFTDLKEIVEWVKNRKRSSDSLVARFAQEKFYAEITGISPGSYLLDHYRIIKEIGRGGMSTVYLAVDEFRNKSVAVKVALKENTIDFGSIVQSLNAEVDIMKRLAHPFLPRIYDVIEKPDMMVIIMDYIEGRTVKSIIEEYGAMTEDQVIKIGRQLCEALQYLHQMTPPIIYRDMKPGNIMMRPNGDVMLIDFGTAREFKERNLADTTCLGTVGYAAPEQFGGMGQTDARTDVYGLGVTLYHLITNMNPSEPIIVTILGSGAIGTEFFLTTYWCGQMLDCKLHINVVSKEKQNEENDSKREGNFEGRINFINPEILKTNNPNSDLLIYSEDGERSDPYFSYKYRESDVLSDDFVTLMEEPELLNTDYFIVALGSDEDNLEVANKLRQIVGVHHMYSAPKKKTVISYVIYNSVN